MVRDARQHHFKEEPPEDAERQPGEERATGGDQLAPLERPEEKPKGSSQHQEEQQAYSPYTNQLAMRASRWRCPAACKRGASHRSTPSRRPAGTATKTSASSTSMPYVQIHSV